MLSRQMEEKNEKVFLNIKSHFPYIPAILSAANNGVKSRALEPNRKELVLKLNNILNYLRPKFGW